MSGCAMKRTPPGWNSTTARTIWISSPGKYSTREWVATVGRFTTPYTDCLLFSPASASPGHRGISTARPLFGEHTLSPHIWKGLAPTCVFHEILLLRRLRLQLCTPAQLTQPSKARAAAFLAIHSRER